MLIERVRHMAKKTGKIQVLAHLRSFNHTSIIPCVKLEGKVLAFCPVALSPDRLFYSTFGVSDGRILLRGTEKQAFRDQGENEERH